MRAFRQKYPIWASLIVLAVSLAACGLATLVLQGVAWVRPESIYANEYQRQLVVELIWMLSMVFLTILFGMEDLFFDSRSDFLDSFGPAAVLIAFYAMALLGFLAMSIGQPVRPLGEIALFILCMAMVGFVEELAFRGLIVGMIYRKYGTAPAGVWFSVLSSALIFGAMHLTNLIVAPVNGVLAQVGAAALMGTMLSAIYLRTRNYWAMAALHGFMDFCVLVPSGLFYGSGIESIIGDYSVRNVLVAMIYLGFAAFLLRPSQMVKILLPGAIDQHVRGKLLTTIGILAGLLIIDIVLLCI